MSIIDIYYSWHFSKNRGVLNAELRADHRVKERMFILQHLPSNSVGAELGVFTGLLSAIFARTRKFAKVTFVDPWWTMYGERYPDWGQYTDFGRLRTEQAYLIAKRRIESAGLPGRDIEVESSYKWLEASHSPKFIAPSINGFPRTAHSLKLASA